VSLGIRKRANGNWLNRDGTPLAIATIDDPDYKSPEGSTIFLTLHENTAASNKPLCAECTADS
jgi:hypothetical protein